MAYTYRRSLGPIGFLIIVNLIVFFTALFRPDLIITQLGLQRISLMEHPWTIITNMFVHASFGHIFGNMLTLYFFGSYLISLIGEKNFFIVYFAGGLLGNIFFLVLGSPIAIAIGASGAVFAVGGALTVLRPNLRVIIFPIPAPIPLWIATVGGFLLLSFLPGIAWEAHLGGILFGAAFGYWFRRRGIYF
ncbi:MAG: rhomboid family intramembrane serine protease [Chloroflexi bacterium]|nr:rhomboid family intramembrane serine protease [Chloroflexota bacterium]